MSKQLPVIPNTPEWLAERRNRIGASDAPIVLDCSSFMTSRDLAIQKLEAQEATTPEENKFLKRGHLLEPLVRMLYIAQTNHAVLTVGMHVHDDYEWMSATPDGLIRAGGIDALLECKTVSKFNRHKWVEVAEDGTEIDTPPLMYWIQAQHQMEVTGHDTVNIATMFASDDLFDLLVKMVEADASIFDIFTFARDVVEFKIYPVHRNDEYIAMMVEKEKSFWENLQQGIIPADIKYMADSGAIRIANEEEEDAIADLKAAYLRKKLATEDYDECVEKLKYLIGEDSGLHSASYGKVTFKRVRGKRTTKWHACAEELFKQLGWSDDDYDQLVEEFTTISEPSRRFTAPYKDWEF